MSVTASRGAPALQSPASVSVLTSADLAASAAGTVDDALRSTPGFSLFRRSSSRVTNPTAQGVTLRGVSGSGASRTLVLADGFPLNDPFGSWVYWNRIPMAAIDRVEVVRGAAGDIWGAEALGGVIQILTADPPRGGLRAAAEAASLGTARMSAFGSVSARDWRFAGAGEWMRTGGYTLVAPAQRGTVDVAANSGYSTAFTSAGYATGAWRAGLRASLASESRGNGTALQRNSTDWRQVTGVAAGSAAGGHWTIQAGAGSQSYVQSFSSVSAARDSERLTTEQHVPTQFALMSAQWVRPLGRHALLIGSEARYGRAEIRETRYAAAGTATGPFLSGGSGLHASVFARASVALRPTVSVAAGGRVDLWRPSPRESGPARGGVTRFTPRLSASWSPRQSLAIFGSAYQGTRTPTANELYRGFRAGNVVTAANPDLRPERLTGLEGGVRLSRGIASARATAYASRLAQAVTNVTLASTPALITRQRQNTDTLLARGLELELEVRPHRDWSFKGTAVLATSRFAKSPAQPGLEGKRVPQTPRIQAGGAVTWARPGVATVSAEMRAAGAQFDDDQNALVLGGYGLLDVVATRPVARAAQVFVALENVFDARPEVGRTPVVALGYPRSIRGGVRLFLR